jgi:hypothetical protein
VMLRKDALLSCSDAVGDKFYHVMTKFYHAVMLKMILLFSEIEKDLGVHF